MFHWKKVSRRWNIEFCDNLLLLAVNAAALQNDCVCLETGSLLSSIGIALCVDMLLMRGINFVLFLQKFMAKTKTFLWGRWNRRWRWLMLDGKNDYWQVTMTTGTQDNKMLAKLATYNNQPTVLSIFTRLSFSLDIGTSPTIATMRRITPAALQRPGSRPLQKIRALWHVASRI